MLKIVNIETLMNTMSLYVLNREMKTIEEKDHFGTPCYVFSFLGETPMGDWKFEDKFEIFLYRTPNQNGLYELYWMGLHGITNELIPKSEIENKSLFLMNLNKVIDKAKDYYTQLNPF